MSSKVLAKRVDAQAPAPSAATDVAVSATVPAERAPKVDMLTFHRANYFISGFTDATQVKYQISVKYDLWPSGGAHTVYFAYTQKSLWDVYDESSPFRELNFAPEIFYAHYHSKQRAWPDRGCGLFSEQLGVEHESNGAPSDDSLSWNRVFLDVTAACVGQTLYGALGLRAWYPLDMTEDQAIVDTQGYGELMLGLGLDTGDPRSNVLVTVAVRHGTTSELGKGSLMLDARWRPLYSELITTSFRFAPYIWFQWFTGYGETLGTFDDVTNSLRLGIGFTDRR